VSVEDLLDDCRSLRSVVLNGLSEKIKADDTFKGWRLAVVCDIDDHFLQETNHGWLVGELVVTDLRD